MSMKFMSRFWQLFLQNLLQKESPDAPSKEFEWPDQNMRAQGAGDFWQVFGDEHAEFTRGDNDFGGELNFRTGRYDNGTDPYGWYEDGFD